MNAALLTLAIIPANQDIEIAMMMQVNAHKVAQQSIEEIPPRYRPLPLINPALIPRYVSIQPFTYQPIQMPMYQPMPRYFNPGYFFQRNVTVCGPNGCR